MKPKSIILPVLALSSLCGGPESSRLVDSAANRPTKACIVAVEDYFGDDLAAAVEENRYTAVAADNHTIADLDEFVTDEYVATLERWQDYKKKHVSVIGMYVLQNSGIRIQLSSDVSWELDEQALEGLLEASYRLADPDDEFQTKSNECTADQVFKEHVLGGVTLDVTILGAGNYCIARDRLMPRGGPYNCPVAGITRSNNEIVLTPGHYDNQDVSQNASMILVHEWDHAIRTLLKSRPDSSTKIEYSAYELMGKGYGLIRDMDEPPLKLLTSD